MIRASPERRRAMRRTKCQSSSSTPLYPHHENKPASGFHIVFRNSTSARRS